MSKEGTFIADVIGARLTEAKTGTLQVAIEFRLEDGSRITAFKPVTENALKYTLPALRVCGWRGDDLDDLSSVHGGQVELVLEAEEYDGKMRTKVRFINPIGGGAKPAAPGAGKEWRDRIRALANADETKAPF